MKCVYPEMESLIAVRGIKKKAIASKLGISERCLYNKMKGKVPFTWPEVEALQKGFFPDIGKDKLLTKSNQPAS